VAAGNSNRIRKDNGKVVNLCKKRKKNNILSGAQRDGIPRRTTSG
jgi:hypothetical protein